MDARYAKLLEFAVKHGIPLEEVGSEEDFEYLLETMKGQSSTDCISAFQRLIAQDPESAPLLKAMAEVILPELNSPLMKALEEEE